MTRKSIIPQDFVPTFDCVIWLNREVLRLMDLQSEAVRNWHNSNAKTLGIFRNIIAKALTEAFYRNLYAEEKRLADESADNEKWQPIVIAEAKRLDRLFNDRDVANGMPF